MVTGLKTEATFIILGPIGKIVHIYLNDHSEGGSVFRHER